MKSVSAVWIYKDCNGPHPWPMSGKLEFENSMNEVERINKK